MVEATLGVGDMAVAKVVALEVGREAEDMAAAKAAEPVGEATADLGPETEQAQEVEGTEVGLRQGEVVVGMVRLVD